MSNLIADLDEFFCEKFSNYDMITCLPGYVMPKMHATETDAFGRKYSYTLPKETMRLTSQENRAELLKALKEKLVERDFSFSFHPATFFQFLKNKHSKTGMKNIFRVVAKRNHLTVEELFDGVEIDGEIVQGLKKGKFFPTKNLIFSLALTGHLQLDDVELLMKASHAQWDYAMHKDVVVRYLLENRIFNADMVQQALDAYKITYLFLKKSA